MARVTLGLPAFNSDPVYFDAALRSLLSQDFGDFKIILSDNGSAAAAESLYREAARLDRRIRYVRHPANLGAVFNFNCVLREADDEYFCWVADDDIRHPA